MEAYALFTTFLLAIGRVALSRLIFIGSELATPDMNKVRRSLNLRRLANSLFIGPQPCGSQGRATKQLHKQPSLPMCR
jgi:hypothetical protein